MAIGAPATVTQPPQLREPRTECARSTASLAWRHETRRLSEPEEGTRKPPLDLENVADEPNKDVEGVRLTPTT